MTEFLKGILSLLVLLSGMGVVLFAMFVALKKRDLTVKLPIDRDKLARMPGFGLQNQILDHQFNLLSGLFMATLVMCLPFAIKGVQGYLTIGSLPWVYVILPVLALPYFGFKTYRNMSKLTKLRLGHTAELATASELMRLQGLGYQVFHDIQADGFNIDHLVVGPNGVFAIETKGRHKRFRDKKYEAADKQKAYELLFKDGKLQFPSWVETSPISQADRQAKWVSEWLTKAVGQSTLALPVLVFPGWYVTTQTKPPFPIINHKQLVGTIPKLNRITYNQEQINAIAYQVAQRCVQGS
ncbi:NERD domain-containing protein [Shewanella psychropiezotolerans]|uniref:NERD domain-containing protein n=1 Tax=Shewanella psychropiezotolerans TaxID=2593655 RepID=A0ABX5WYG7_9GAMM|nr:nuclease-related domain-containing protein [Shewanella psychropiezotolerans]QDO84135.1 NERD domain-containing protein [Shewanella psychropiezotolerans]